MFDLARFNTPEMRLRLLSAAILAPLTLAIVGLGGPLYVALILLATTIGLWEWQRLVDPAAPQTDQYALYAASLLTIILTAANLSFFAWIVLIVATGGLYHHRNSTEPATAPFLALGLPYMALSGMSLISLRSAPDGLTTIFYLLAIVWGMDSGAYIGGRLIGGAKMAPAISPNKTWSGLFSGMAASVVLAGIVLLFAGSQSFWTGLLIAAILGAIAQAGDLFKSFFKRRAGVKDCGNLIPGHGGILDRIDGLVFAAMALALLQALGVKI